jgi:hypothetical protein
MFSHHEPRIIQIVAWMFSERAVANKALLL